MVTLVNRTQRRRSLKKPSMSKVDQMVAQVVSHAAWKGEMSSTQVEALLEGHKPFTYALTQGRDKYHYVLSYVEFDNTIRHKPVRILFSHGDWIIRNCGGNTYATIYPLIPYCLQCGNDQCKPLA